MSSTGSSKKKRSLRQLETEIDAERKKLEGLRGCPCYDLLLGETNIRKGLVDDVFEHLRTQYEPGDRLDVVVDSAGGEILMSPVAELGPLDPQITEMNPLEQRVERFSPLHIESTLQLIRDEFNNGNDRLADGLMQRLQFPLTLGSFKKSLDVGREYVEKLLTSRMLKSNEAKAKEIGKELTTGYADHSWCITMDEASALGLRSAELTGAELDVVWQMHKLDSERQRVLTARTEKRVREQLKNLPREILGKQARPIAQEELTNG